MVGLVAVSCTSLDLLKKNLSIYLPGFSYLFTSCRSQHFRIYKLIIVTDFMAERGGVELWEGEADIDINLREKT